MVASSVSRPSQNDAAAAAAAIMDQSQAVSVTTKHNLLKRNQKIIKRITRPTVAFYR